MKVKNSLYERTMRSISEYLQQLYKSSIYSQRVRKVGVCVDLFLTMNIKIFFVQIITFCFFNIFPCSLKDFSAEGLAKVTQTSLK